VQIVGYVEYYVPIYIYKFHETKKNENIETRYPYVWFYVS